jgi:hypothetical protein
LDVNAQELRRNVRMPDLVRRVVVLVTLFTAQLAAQTISTYRGELQLPVDLYTSDGVLLEKGKFEIEVRYERDYALVFAKKDKTLARVGGQTVSGEQLKEVFQGVPLIGTLRLETPEPSGPAKETGNETPSNPSPYLRKFSWQVTLRAFEAPNKNDVVLVFRKNGTAEPPTTVAFRLFSNKPK